MPIDLKEIRLAVVSYFDTMVTTEITDLVAATPAAISPDEEFSFSVNVVNHGEIDIQVRCFHILIQRSPLHPRQTLPEIMYVKNPDITYRSNPWASGEILTSGKWNEVYLFPPTGVISWGLSTNCGKVIEGLKGKAASQTSPGGALGKFLIRARILGGISNWWLLPEMQGSAYGSQDANVV